MTDAFARLRRLRRTPQLRDLVAQTHLEPGDLIAPLFVRAGQGIRRPIASMPGQFQLSPDTALEELKKLQTLGLRGYILFGITEPADKDPLGSFAHHFDNPVCQTLRRAKEAGISLLAMTDLCYCEYTSHGHCGPLDPRGSVDNDLTIQRLGDQAVIHAQAGADILAPSGMMDGAVGAIRSTLNATGFSDRVILSYAVKYASSYYGPFRDAAESPPQFGDRRSYQMDFRRDAREALQEAHQDIRQGADLVMVKPGIAYLDILQQVAAAVSVPCGVYQVSGEYAMSKAAAAAGWIDEKPLVLETLTAFKRAGAAFILSYYAGEVAGWLQGGR